MGKWLMLAGAMLSVIGFALHSAPWLINWFGRLPGDIRIDSGRTQVFIPITSMLLISVILSIAVHLIRRFF